MFKQFVHVVGGFPSTAAAAPDQSARHARTVFRLGRARRHWKCVFLLGVHFFGRGLGQRAGPGRSLPTDGARRRLEGR